MPLSYFEYRFQALGGINLVKLAAASQSEADRVAERVVAEVTRIESKYSRYRDDSIVSRINAAAGEEAVPVDQETKELLNYASACFQESGQLFDLTSGILRRVWNFRQPRLPLQEEIEPLLPLIGWEKVEWDGKSVFLPRPGMEIDLGGIGKEYAADRASIVLAEADIQSGFVNLSGDVAVVGPRLDGSPWVIGVQHPRLEGVLGGIGVSQGAVASSGDYERYFEQDGVRYCHILNPKSGFPVQDLQAVTVQSDSCMVAGSIATIVMLLGEKPGQKYLRKCGASYLLVDSGGGVRTSPSFMVEQSRQTEALQAKSL